MVSLSLHRAERADALVRGLAGLLAQTPADPFVPDLVAVPSRGVERWIAQSLSSRLGVEKGSSAGVCANVHFPSPGRLVSEALTAAVGFDRDSDPWAEERLPFALLEVIEACAGEDWCHTLARHLGLTGAQGGGGAGGPSDGPDGGAGPGTDDDAARGGRRYAAARKIAGLYSAYGAQRPAMLRDWATGDDTDGHGAPLDTDLTWQAELWRRLRTHLDAPSPAERLDDAVLRLRDEPGIVDLPERLSLFGPTRLSTDQVAVIDALAAHRDVHLWLPHPSDALWRTVAAADPGITARVDDPTRSAPSNPLLASCGRDARELQVRLAASLTAPATDEHLDPVEQPATGTLLAAVQRDIRDDRAPAGDHRPAEHDRSVQVHACHGRQRQVEVLRETLLGLLEDDPTLELRDIVVMCPDIEAYAPLISATFGLTVEPSGTAGTDQGEVHPGHRLRVRLADRALRQTNPVLSVVARLLDLADARLTVSEVLDLAAMPAVRARFGFDDDEVERIGDWVRRSGVRWGLDAAARAPYHLDTVPQNTWQTGLDRVLVGVTMDEEELRPLGHALPLDDVDSNEVDLAGRLAELVDRLGLTVGALRRPQTLEEWAATLTTAVDDLTSSPPFEEWQSEQALREITDALAAGDRDGVRLGLGDVRALLAQRLKGRPTRANFRTGQLTMCTMVPMRSVPHRVVCLLGLDDGVFPRTTHVDGDDVLARTPLVGERDRRAEDRQLFLDAVLAAEETLVMLYTGADERTGAERPPAVPLGELLDVVDRTVAPSGGTPDDGTAPGTRPGRDHVLVRHPLQPFDGRNFRGGALGRPEPFSFDGASYAGAGTVRAERMPEAPFLAQPLPEEDLDEVVEIDDLVRFLEHPVKAFLRQRLGISEFAEDDEIADALPVRLDGLEQWQVGDRMLVNRLAGADADRATRAEWLRGDLPPGALGKGVLDPIARNVDALLLASEGLREGPARTVDVDAALPDGTRLVGTVTGVHGGTVVRIVYSRLGAKHRLRAWVQLLTLVADGRAPSTGDGRPWQAATVGRGKDRPVASAMQVPTREDACRILDVLVAVYRLGRCEPLPLSPKTSCAYAERRARSGVDAATKWAAREWRQERFGGDIGDFDDVEHRRVWGESTIATLVDSAPARTDLSWVQQWPDEAGWFGQLARAVWTPLLEHERSTGG